MVSWELLEDVAGIRSVVQEVLAQITQSLPDELKSSLPTVEEIEAELGGDLV
jgi:hypothetical protein